MKMEGTKEVEWPRKAEIRKAEFLATGEACKSILWPTPGVNERTFNWEILSLSRKTLESMEKKKEKKEKEKKKKK